MKTSAFTAALLILAQGIVYTAETPPVDWTRDVKPVLVSRCINCHHSGSMLGQLSLESRGMAFQKRAGGPVIIPGRPDSSLLYQVLKLPPKNLKAMPPFGHRITDKEINLIYDWIMQGAAWPEGKAGTLKPLKGARTES